MISDVLGEHDKVLQWKIFQYKLLEIKQQSRKHLQSCTNMIQKKKKTPSSQEYQ